jgi:SAM-dependent methyltransferase
MSLPPVAQTTIVNEEPTLTRSIAPLQHCFESRSGRGTAGGGRNAAPFVEIAKHHSVVIGGAHRREAGATDRRQNAVHRTPNTRGTDAAERTHMTMTAAASAAYQRDLYAERYAYLRQAYDFFRYDARYRLQLMEETFRAHDIPFERQRVFELGFGTGSLLLRFDVTSTLHGCEISTSAVRELTRDPRVQAYRDPRFLLSQADGMPRFPGSDYDVVIASHVLEHVPDDRAVLDQLAERTKSGGWGLFFLPLERPRHNPDHARVYTAAGFCQLLRETGFEPVVVDENFRFASHFVQLINWPSRARIPVLGTLVEVTKSAALAMMPTELVGVFEQPLARLHVLPMQLMVLARRTPRRSA